jgi:hypothetical protein
MENWESCGGKAAMVHLKVHATLIQKYEFGVASHGITFVQNFISAHPAALLLKHAAGHSQNYMKRMYNN